jgi:hypothetical protein
MSPVILWVFVSTIGVTLSDLPKPIMLIATRNDVLQQNRLALAK